MSSSHPGEFWTNWIFLRFEKLATSSWRTYALISAIIMADSIILGPFSYLSWHDLGDSHLSRYVAMLHRISQGSGIALWYPEAAGGADLLANGARYFDGFFLLLNVMPAWLAIGLVRFVQMLIAGVFMNRILREHLNLEVAPAFVGGLAFLLLQRNLLEVYMGVGALPLMLWALARLSDFRPMARYASAIALGAAWSSFSFFHLTFLFCLPGMTYWLWFVASRQGFRLIVLLGVFSAAYTLFQLDMLVAMALNSPFSHRAYWDLTLPPWSEVSETIWPQAMVSFEFFVLAGTAAIFGARRHASSVIALAIIVTLVISWVQYDVRLALPDHLNAIKGFNMYRFIEFLPVLWAALIGCGWQAADDILRTKLGFRRHVVGAVAFATILLLAWQPLKMVALNAEDWIKWGSYFANYRDPQLIALAERARSEVPFRVATIQEKGLLPSYANSYGLESADSYLNLYPYHYGLMWRLVIAPTLARDPALRNYVVNYGPRLSLFTDDGSTHPKRAADYFNLDLLSLLGVRYIISKVPIDDASMTLISVPNPNGFSNDLSLREKIMQRLMENFHGRSVLLYQNENVLPRWFFVRQTEILPNEEILRDRMASMSAQELRQTALVNGADIQAVPPPARQSSEIVGYRYGADRIMLDVNVPEAAFLVVANSYSPFWTCRLDGKPAPIIRTDLSLWGVDIPAGTKSVEFAYNPPYRLIANDHFYNNISANQ